MPDASILPAYEKALALSAEMLRAAQEAKWEALVGIEREYTATIESVKERDTADTRDLAFLRKKTALIEAILANTEKVRLLAGSRMEELRGTITSAQQEIKLNRAYFTDQF